ncbi:TrmH family RNA methyltransferase [Alicyclobacillus dauci]|uniref:RNA methyltransferase n=1 Tax=Alicyclobacillus dauci TaxID=1475485 RepID=A0ABY6Z640_9BACL|nr:RNA methyltransferase [Alicyclobacillus dauci]WAH38341.1 RNA methyltransferase [Alicyclobacillus dauci]
MYIESPQNARVRAWSQLKSKKVRSRQGLFLVEGRRLVEELVGSAYELEALLWNVAADEPPSHLTEHPKFQGHVYELSPAAFALVSDTTTPQGLIAIAKLPETGSQAGSISTHAVLLDGIQDPGNVGTLLRSCEAFGFHSVCCGTSTVDPFAPKVVRSAMGGMFRLDLWTEDSVQFIEDWRRNHPDGRVIVAAADADELCYSADMRRPTLVVIGSEAFGASDEVRELADLAVAIPMQADTESLNAAVAGSILLYEAYRQGRP